jgi:hypothetical protein
MIKVLFAIATALATLTGSAAFAQSVNPVYGTGESRAFYNVPQLGSQNAFAQIPAASNFTGSETRNGVSGRTKRFRLHRGVNE